MTQELERMSIPLSEVQSDNSKTMSACSSTHKNKFIAENLPYNLVLPSIDASVTCFKFKAMEHSKVIPVK